MSKEVRTVSREEQSVIDAFKQSKCYEKIMEVVTKYDEFEEEAQNVLAKDQILDACVNGGNVERRKLHVKQVGALPANRGGEGLVWKRAHTRASKIKTSGFSAAALRDNAWLLQENPFSHEIGKYTEALTMTSVHYAQIKAAQVEGGCLGSTHASHGFACVYDEVPCSIENISTKGSMDRKKVFARDAGYEHAVMEGVEYQMIKWFVGAACPRAMSIVSDALNTVNQIAEGNLTQKNK